MAIQHKLPLILIGIGLSLFLFSCSRPYIQDQTSERVQPISLGDDYIIGAGDVLEIQVWRNQDLSKVAIVRPDGKISLPLMGEIKAAGLSSLQLRNRIIDELKKLGETPEATIIVREINSFAVYVIGEVQRPGRFQLNGNTTVVQAIAMAGGFKEFASPSRITLLRKVEGQYTEHRITINYDDIVSGKKRNIWLQPGDTLVVP